MGNQDHIIHKQCLTEQEIVQRIKAIKEIFPKANGLMRDEKVMLSESTIVIYGINDDEIPFYITTIRAERFPFVNPGEIVNIDDIIGGKKK